MCCFINLLRILTIATAFEITKDNVSILTLLVEDYLQQFNQLYPASITPKMHYMLHLPQQILQYVKPLIKFNCITMSF